MPLTYYTENIQTIDKDDYVKVCPGAEVRLYVGMPALDGAADPIGELAVQVDADGSNARPAVLHADRYGGVSAWLETGSYWAASKCCDDWSVHQLCIGCPAGPKGRDAPCFTRNGAAVDPDGDCIELCEACPQLPCGFNSANDIDGLVISQLRGEDVPLEVDLSAAVSTSDPVTIRIKIDSLYNAVVKSFDGAVARIVSSRSGCDGGGEFEVICDGEVIATKSFSFVMAEGSTWFAPSLMDHSVYPTAPNTYVAPGDPIVGRWSSDSHYLGYNVYPNNKHPTLGKINAIAIMDQQFDGTGNTDGSEFVKQSTFPGWPERGVKASTYMWYFNGSVEGAAYNGLKYILQPSEYTPGAQYVLQVSGSDAINPELNTPVRPQLRWRVNGADIGVPFVLTNEHEAGSGDIWQHYEIEFTVPTDGSALVIELNDEALGEYGDDAVVYPIGLRQKNTC